LESRQEIEAVSLNLSLMILNCYMEAEIARRQGHWEQQTHNRHGTQPDYVVYTSASALPRRTRFAASARMAKSVSRLNSAAP
jgi:hypothetical protein